MLSSQKWPKRVSLSYRQTKILPMSMCLPKELTFNANLKLNSTWPTGILINCWLRQIYACLVLKLPLLQWVEEE